MQAEKPKIDPTEFLGRSVSDRKRAKYAHDNGVLYFRSLLPRSGEHVISVDKLIRNVENNSCNYTEKHVRVATEREGTFYGWGYFTSGELLHQTPCQVEFDPLPANPNHVLVIYPEELKLDKIELKYVAKEIALLTNWLEVKDPTTPKPEEP